MSFVPAKSKYQHDPILCPFFSWRRGKKPQVPLSNVTASVSGETTEYCGKQRSLLSRGTTLNTGN